MRVYKISEYTDPLETFCNKHDYNYEELSWLGKGDFGEAYLTPDNKVVKVTTDKKECSIAKELMNQVNGPFAKVFLVEIINGSCFILQEYVDTNSEIEDLYYQAENYVQEQGEDIETIDIDDIEDNTLKQFIDELQWIYDFQRRMGIMGADIRPENLGRNSDGELVCFDITERSDWGHFR